MKSPAAERLTDLTGFSPNPGALRARLYCPPGLKPAAALVVALHGCTQDAACYDRGTGWSMLADQIGFALLLPEQVPANNPNRCFNWFQPDDVARTGGEVESIAAMIRATIAAHALDPARVFITGLSAGGAMTAAMLATWPELFRAGAIIGGLAYRDAAGVPDALARMRGHGGADDRALVEAVRRASGGYAGRWPAVSVWHGTADATVSAVNADRLVRQWRGVHDVTDGAETALGAGWTRRTWRRNGRVAVEEWSIAGMGHGVPIDPRGVNGLGHDAAHMLDVGVNSTALIARGWGLMPALPSRGEQPAMPAAALSPAAALTSIGQTIGSALRSAGLMP